jgi:altronate dehydratase small subunit
MAADCFMIDAADNVATMLAATEGGLIGVRNSADIGTIEACEAIDLGHKIALADIATGEAVIKFGVAIGHASRPIRRGAWVHLHNCTSGFDARSGTLDPHSGATTDTRYE